MVVFLRFLISLLWSWEGAMYSAVLMSLSTTEAFTECLFRPLTLLDLLEFEQGGPGLLLGVLYGIGLPCSIIHSFFFPPAAIFQGSSVLTIL